MNPRLIHSNPFERPATVDGRTVDAEAKSKKVSTSMARKFAGMYMVALAATGDSMGSFPADAEQNPGGAAMEVVPQEQEEEVVPQEAESEIKITPTFGSSRAERSLTNCLQTTRLSLDECTNRVMAGNE